MMKTVLEKGQTKTDRTGTGTISIFGYQARYNLEDGFPLVTTKKVHLKSIIYELLWFIKGDTNIKYLVDHGVSIWNDWPYKLYKESAEYQNETIQEFAEKIKNDDDYDLSLLDKCDSDTKVLLTLEDGKITDETVELICN